MLIRADVLAKIAAGQVTLAFRRWRRPTVRIGGTLRTSIGVLAIDSVKIVNPARITKKDTIAAGYSTVAELRAFLDSRPEGEVYRVGLHLVGEDPRIGLRAADFLAEEDIATIQKRLSRWDTASTHGPWTRETLQLIADNPGVRAADLAASVGREKLPFKADVRKLKELGLTESLDVGYRLSPRAQAFLRRSP